MEVMVILIGFSLLVALGFLGAFFWAVRSGQFDDAVTPSYRILFDDRKGPKHTSRNTAQKGNSSPIPPNHTSQTTSNQTERDR